MRTGPSLTDLNNQMILWEYERALIRGKGVLAYKIRMANPQIHDDEFLRCRILSITRGLP